MAKAVKIPVTVKMRAGWNDDERNAPTLARMVAGRRRRGGAVHGRTAAQSYSGSADWDLVAQRRRRARDSGVRQRRLHRAGADRRAAAGGRRGRARRPRRAAQSLDSRAGRGPRRRPAAARGHARRSRAVPARLHRSAAERARASRGSATRETRAAQRLTTAGSSTSCARLASWYTKGLDNGSHLRTAINSADSLASCATRSGRFSSPTSQPHSGPVSYPDSCVCR